MIRGDQCTRLALRAGCNAGLVRLMLDLGLGRIRLGMLEATALAGVGQSLSLAAVRFTGFHLAHEPSTKEGARGSAVFAPFRVLDALERHERVFKSNG